MRIRRTGLAAGAALLAAALGLTLALGGGEQRQPGILLTAAAAPEPAPSAAELTATSQATEAFGVDLYRALAQQQNVALSPAGLAAVLGMLLPSAHGTTQQELATALRTRLPADRYAMALGALRAQPGDKRVVLKQSDTLWAQHGYPVRQDYLALLAAAFRTGVRTTDFAKDPDGSRNAVNQLVEQQTGGLVKNLFAPGQLDSGTLLALTDALYLKADWETPFKAADSTDQAFHRLDGSTPEVRMMHQNDDLRYAAGTGPGAPWQAVELPYVGGDLAMDLVVPDQGDFDAFRGALTGPVLDQVLGALTQTRIELAVPKFSLQSDEDLNGALAGLGVRTAFSTAADLTGLVPAGTSPKPVLTSVVQKAVVQVDETGTTAAAGSGAAVGATAVAPPRVSARLTVDRPFVFLIRDLRSGQLLFLGQVTDPQG
ncbi:serpin family protein [Kitasatospora viridis]|uniref:Serpin B n=1 Tax=Kitasatospora viridis TaxID=281105 RepID=A0A561SEX9_9ACTN|nr:serpin family protein [Kitasatospora viridis]TWF73410.1 serpin B [Kitasatospora viridis]